jgi:hypothetical protein
MLRGQYARAVAAPLARDVLDARDLPPAIRPAHSEALDGWRFA